MSIKTIAAAALPVMQLAAQEQGRSPTCIVQYENHNQMGSCATPHFPGYQFPGKVHGAYMSLFPDLALDAAYSGAEVPA